MDSLHSETDSRQGTARPEQNRTGSPETEKGPAGEGPISRESTENPPESAGSRGDGPPPAEQAHGPVEQTDGAGHKPRSFAPPEAGAADPCVDPVPRSPAGRILGAARQLFADQGFRETSTRAIAARAEVNLALIHYYFGSKERLYRRVLAGEIAGLFRAMTAQWEAADLPPEEFVAGLPVAVMRHLRRRPRAALLLRREIAADGPRLRELILEMGDAGPRGFRRRIGRIAATAAENGRLRVTNLDHLPPVLVSLAYGSVLMEPFLRLVTGLDTADEEVWNAHCRTVDDLVRNGLLKEDR